MNAGMIPLPIPRRSEDAFALAAAFGILGLVLLAFNR